MSTNNCNKEDYSMDKSTDAIDKLEGGSGDTDDISDDELFKQPPNEECPICNLLLPWLASGSVYKSCCGKMLCSGCCHAPVYDNLGNEIIGEKCPFCRTPVPTAIERIERYKKRAEHGNAEAIFTLGNYYRVGKLGFPQDYNKALELFVRAGNLGCNKAYNNVGCAYDFGEGVEMDEKKAMHYYKLAAIEGNVTSRYNLGNYEQRAGNMNRALKHYMIAAKVVWINL